MRRIKQLCINFALLWEVTQFAVQHLHASQIHVIVKFEHDEHKY